MNVMGLIYSLVLNCSLHFYAYAAVNKKSGER